ncbi:MAG: hypothetical protein IJS59_06720 [Bacteroidaceae bacterium]|nr:hypothetical protein [Bacteroidaceae bacterium]
MKFSTLSIAAAMIFLDVAPVQPTGCGRDDEESTRQTEVTTSNEDNAQAPESNKADMLPTTTDAQNR